MNLTSREDVIKAAYRAVMSRGDSDLMIELESRADDYGEQQHLVDDVNRWLKKFPTSTRIEELNDWLSELP
jgi:hypothetical protein